jgi:hypothetical protein
MAREAAITDLRGGGSEMKAFILICGFATLLTGLIAAWFWFKSSLVTIRPLSFQLTGPGRDQFNFEAWRKAVNRAFEQAGKLNTKAAAWTAGSVILGAITTFLGALQTP